MAQTADSVNSEVHAGFFCSLCCVWLQAVFSYHLLIDRLLCGGHKITCGSWFSSFTMQILGIYQVWHQAPLPGELPHGSCCGLLVGAFDIDGFPGGM